MQLHVGQVYGLLDVANVLIPGDQITFVDEDLRLTRRRLYTVEYVRYNVDPVTTNPTVYIAQLVMGKTHCTTVASWYIARCGGDPNFKICYRGHDPTALTRWSKARDKIGLGGPLSSHKHGLVSQSLDEQL